MPVNTGFGAEERNTNCALCTAAALVGEGSGDVNADMQIGVGAQHRWGPLETDDAFGGYVAHNPFANGQRVVMQNNAIQPVADQMTGIACYVAQRMGIGTQVRFGGSPVNRSRANTVLPFMNRQPDGTRFAVFTSDGGFFGVDAHWIYAEKAGGVVTFTDFQTDMQAVPGSAPTVSLHPLAPGGQEYVNGLGQTNMNTFMIAIAFGQNLVA